MALYKAVTDRRYSQIWQRVRSAMVCTSGKCLPEIAPQGHFLALRAQGATSASGLLAMTNLVVSAVGGVHRNLQLPMALTTRKGHAASVRRQSRQRLRRERRYRRNRLVRFYRQPVRIGSAFPRLHPKGTSSRCALRAPRRPPASSQ